MPTVNYADIVKFSQDNASFPVNLLEALIQGTIYNDEPLAPLNYLLTPDFLSSDRARIAAYAVSASVKYLKVPAASTFIFLILSLSASLNSSRLCFLEREEKASKSLPTKK